MSSILAQNVTNNRHVIMKIKDQATAQHKRWFSVLSRKLPLKTPKKNKFIPLIPKNEIRIFSQPNPEATCRRYPKNTFPRKISKTSVWPHLNPPSRQVLSAITLNYSCNIKFVNDAIIIYSLLLKNCLLLFLYPSTVSIWLPSCEWHVVTFLLSLFSSTATVILNILNGTHGRKAIGGKKKS